MLVSFQKPETTVEKALDDINQKQNDAIEKLVNQLGEYPVGAH